MPGTPALSLLQPLFDHPVAWAFFAAYIAITTYLAWKGGQVTRG